MVSFPKYDRYKDSGVQWLGDIPEHWEVKKLKYTSVFVTTGKTPPSSNETYFDGNVDWFTPSDFKDNLYLANSNRKISEKALIKENLKLYPPETILLIGIGATLGKVGMIRKSAFSNQQINAIYFNNKLIYPSYGLYYLHSQKETIKNFANVVTLPIFNQSQTKDFCIILPPLPEQIKIAEFLDKKTTEIDNAISKKQRLIELLEEQKNIIINQAVTKGLNPNSPMKDSGIEWLGYIPEHWEVCKLKHKYQIFLGKMLQPERKTKKDVKKPYLRSANLSNENVFLDDVKEMWFSSKELNDNRLMKGDVLVSEGGDVGRVSFWNYETEMYIQNSIQRLRSLNNLQNSRLLFYWMKFLKASGYIDSLCNSATIAHYTYEKVKNTIFLNIPNIEQIKIAEYLDKKTAEIDLLKQKTAQQIGKLKEYKQILIANAVTGKIKI